MAEQNELIASAVVIPDAPSRSPTPHESLKRRQSTLSENGGSKRIRLSTDNENGIDTAQLEATSPTSLTRRDSALKIGHEEERKRGKRLFGNLLGTLSQSSSTTVQRRRIDIEKKQQAKLKLQEAEHDEEKKRRYDKLMERRRREQQLYDEELMHRRHSNLISMAHFLRTKSEPQLYYKPWELSVEESARIAAQITDAKATVAKELEAVQGRLPRQSQRTESDDPNTESLETESRIEYRDTEGGSGTAVKNVVTRNGDLEGTTRELPDVSQPTILKEAPDDRDESFVEGGEDPVIY